MFQKKVYLSAGYNDYPIVGCLLESLYDVLPVTGHVTSPIALEDNTTYGRGQEVSDGLCSNRRELIININIK